jgi:S1/P1 Nuclease
LRSGNNPTSLRALATDLEKLPPPNGVDLALHIDEWARESNNIAGSFVYRNLTATESRKACRLSSAYVAKANALARQRLVLAAWRLAALLNGTVGVGR